MESKRGDCSGFQSLAPEIISEILARLPIEWIMICKCVCKTWYALINDDYFVKLQLSIANDRPSSRVIFEPSKIRFQHGLSELYLLDVEDCKAREIPGYPLADMNKYNTRMTIMCSLDGLICVGPTGALDPVVIYNPLRRGDYIILPKTEVRTVFVSWHCITLGFDPSINKYKAVRMLKYYDYTTRYSLCEVITIGEETVWRQMVAPYAGFLHLSFRGGVFHKGSIYWIIGKFNTDNWEISKSNNLEYILEFDVTKEVFEVVSFPQTMRAPKFGQNYNDPHRFDMELQILEGGSLALLEMEGRLLHIWRLVKQNGRNAVVGYRSIRIESPYKYATIVALLFPNSTEDFLLLQTNGGYEQVRGRNGGRIKTNGLQFSYYYPYSKKNDRFVYLSPSPYKNFYPWFFKPSFISIKAASLSNL